MSQLGDQKECLFLEYIYTWRYVEFDLLAPRRLLIRNNHVYVEALTACLNRIKHMSRTNMLLFGNIQMMNVMHDGSP